PEWVEPISRDYRGFTLHEIPPNGQGMAALMALGILEHFDMAALEPDSVAARHLQIEAMKAAFADVYRYVADARSMTAVTPADLLDDALLARSDYRGFTLHEIPPNGQGIAALMALGILEHFDMAALEPDSVAARHLQIEAMKAAFADVYRYVADARSMTAVTPADLLDDALLA